MIVFDDESIKKELAKIEEDKKKKQELSDRISQASTKENSKDSSKEEEKKSEWITLYININKNNLIS